MSDNPIWKAVKPFSNGGMSGMIATCCIQPIDIVKVSCEIEESKKAVGAGASPPLHRRRAALPALSRHRTREPPSLTPRALLPPFSPLSQVRIQLGASGSPLGIASNIVKNEGFFTLYRGLSAGLLRQATYTTARLGIFKVITEEAKKANEGKPLPLWQKALCGLTAGGLGSLVGSPADLALIRMQADGTLPKEQRRNYRNAFHSLSSIVKEDGMGGLFVGAGPTVVRAMALNMGMLASNDQAKEMLDSYGVTGLPKIFGASAIAGFFASAFSLPLDFIKTQIQKMKPLPDGTMPYSSALDCAAKTMAEGGPLAFYKGFPTYYVRIAPHSMITLIVLNYITEAQKDMGL